MSKAPETTANRLRAAMSRLTLIENAQAALELVDPLPCGDDREDLARARDDFDSVVNMARDRVRGLQNELMVTDFRRTAR